MLASKRARIATPCSRPGAGRTGVAREPQKASPSARENAGAGRRRARPAPGRAFQSSGAASALAASKSTRPKSLGRQPNRHPRPLATQSAAPLSVVSAPLSFTRKLRPSGSNIHTSLGAVQERRNYDGVLRRAGVATFAQAIATKNASEKTRRWIIFFTPNPYRLT
jgi:hypothetical protein